MVESERLVDSPREAAVTRKRPSWLQNILQEDEGHAAPKGPFRESKRPHKFSSYVALMSRIIDLEPSTFEEATKKQECKDAMMEEYRSETRRQVNSDFQVRSTRSSMLQTTSQRSTKRDLLLEVSPRKRDNTMMKRFL
jgi:hypothetical protein